MQELVFVQTPQCIGHAERKGTGTRRMVSTSVGNVTAMLTQPRDEGFNKKVGEMIIQCSDTTS
jgi:hypothetical protein